MNFCTCEVIVSKAHVQDVGNTKLNNSVVLFVVAIDFCRYNNMHHMTSHETHKGYIHERQIAGGAP